MLLLRSRLTLLKVIITLLLHTITREYSGRRNIINRLLSTEQVDDLFFKGDNSALMRQAPSILAPLKGKFKDSALRRLLEEDDSKFGG